MMLNNFIKNIIVDDINKNKNTKVITRFPPEPNGYLHIGHAKAICLNFELATEFNGTCNLRFDDTNPENESMEYIKSIKEMIAWLGFEGDVKYASDYFEQLYDFAIYFIKNNLAYVCDLTADEIRTHRGTLTTVGRNSKFRDRSIDENLTLFTRMKNGEFPDGSKTLRLKIDMQNANINLRDPVIYRIKHISHIRTKNRWCIYPMYDYTHCISDAIEGITYSCCTLEFEDHRPLYDWILNHLNMAKLISNHPKQIEFSRLELQGTITSKRYLNQLVNEKIVNGWDDPRMPSLAGMKRRGYTANGIKAFIKSCGISKSPNLVDMGMLEHFIREDLENVAPRIMAVLKPLKVILTNFTEDLPNKSVPFHPSINDIGTREVTLTREIYIEASDFCENPDKDYRRLIYGGEVRLRHSYVIKCNNIIKDKDGNIIELHCSIDTNTLGKNPEGRKVNGVIHWVSVTLSVNAKINVYDNLFTSAINDKTLHFMQCINPNSVEIINGYIEPAIKNMHLHNHYHFERIGYFVVDSINPLVFNKTIGLKDTWSKKNNTLK